MENSWGFPPQHRRAAFVATSIRKTLDSHREGGDDAAERIPVCFLDLRSRGRPGAGRLCQKKAAPGAAASNEASPTPAGGGKIPITTSSEEAKAEFLQGRDLAEKLQITDSIAHYQKAVSLDPNFAFAELNLATSAPTGSEFFEHLNKAVGLADKASNGERLLILATQAGANNNAVEAEGAPRRPRRGVSERRAGALRAGRLVLRPAGLREGDRALQEGDGARPDLLDRVQHPGLRLPAERRLRQRREGVPVVRPADPEGPEPVRLATPSST